MAGRACLSGERAARHQRAITLDQDAKITRLTTVWDGATIRDADIKALVLLSLDSRNLMRPSGPPLNHEL